MATMTIKSTYSLDVETVRALERIARRWRVSKSEALRRAIRAAASGGLDGSDDDPLRALDRLQRSLSLKEEAVRRWERSVRQERSAADKRVERRRR